MSRDSRILLFSHHNYQVSLIHNFPDFPHLSRTYSCREEVSSCQPVFTLKCIMDIFISHNFPFNKWTHSLYGNEVIPVDLVLYSNRNHWLTPKKGEHQFSFFLSSMCTPDYLANHYIYCRDPPLGGTRQYIEGNMVPQKSSVA